MAQEMSGLGDRKQLNSKSVDERYVALRDAASSRSLLSIGISCFSLIRTSKSNKLKLHAVTYNVLTLCVEDFVVEPKSLEFLVKHAFDFNSQYSKGIPYYPGADRHPKKLKPAENGLTSECLRELFSFLIFAQKPIILHNSLVDLVFLYQNLYGPAPQDLHTFLSDLAQLFPAGIYDTKYVADYCARTKASYLEYIFRKCQRENWLNNLPAHLSIRFPSFPEDFKNLIEWSFCSDWSHSEFDASQTETICTSFSLHGCCRNEACQLKHDVDLIILAEEAKLEKKREKARNRSKNRILKQSMSANVENGHELHKNSTLSDVTREKILPVESKKCGLKRKRHLKDDDSTDPHLLELMQILDAKRSELEKSTKCEISLEKRGKNGENILKIENSDQKLSGRDRSFYKCAHRAGFDAFMTGYCIGFFALKYYGLKNDSADHSQLSQNGLGDHFQVDAKNFDIPAIKNRIALSGKDFSLSVQKSEFSTTSPYHDEKFMKLAAKM